MCCSRQCRPRVSFLCSKTQISELQSYASRWPGCQQFANLLLLLIVIKVFRFPLLPESHKKKVLELQSGSAINETCRSRESQNSWSKFSEASHTRPMVQMVKTMIIFNVASSMLELSPTKAFPMLYDGSIIGQARQQGAGNIPIDGFGPVKCFRDTSSDLQKATLERDSTGDPTTRQAPLLCYVIG